MKGGDGNYDARQSAIAIVQGLTSAESYVRRGQINFARLQHATATNILTGLRDYCSREEASGEEINTLSRLIRDVNNFRLRNPAAARPLRRIGGNV